MPLPAMIPAFGGPAAAAAAKAAAMEYLPAVSSASLAAVLLKLAWKRCVPEWIREDVSFRKSNTIKDGNNRQEMESLSSVMEKLEALVASASSKLQSPVPFLYASLLAYFQLAAQFKHIDRYKERRNKLYHSSGPLLGSDVSEERIKDLKDALDYATLAYYVEDESFLRSQLEPKGFSLNRCFVVKRPGSVGFYVAISEEEKTVLIGVKGTSSIEDLVTDTCGRSISYHEHHDRDEEGASRIEVRAKIEDTMLILSEQEDSDDGDCGTEIVSGHERIWIEEHEDEESHHVRCHEGIFISAKRLANQVHSMVDSMIQQDYKFVFCGHSLGAGVVSILALILRARFSELSDGESRHHRLQVYAFGPPPVLDHDSAMAATPFILSVVNNADMIARSSLVNLAVFLEVLRSVSKRLQEQGLAPTNPRTTTAFLRKLAQGDKGEPLMTMDEVRLARTAAHDKVELRHPDHLYVPGQLILMFEDWETSSSRGEQQDSKDKGKEEEEESEDQLPQQFCTVTDGTVTVLRWFEIDGYRMLGDHTTTSYYARIDALIQQGRIEKQKSTMHDVETIR